MDERPLVPVEVGEPPHALIVRLAQGPSAGGEGLVGEVVDLLPALGRQATITSLLRPVSATSRGSMKLLKNGSTASLTEVSSLTIVRAAFSSVNRGSNEKPRAVTRLTGGGSSRSRN